MQPFTQFSSRFVVLPNNNIDTDQIIPARFLKTTDKVGLGRALFFAWRYAADGTPRPEFPLNRPDAAGAQILVAGDNFGCGSSREHAPWALLDFGLRTVISTSFGDIFRQNSLKNGLLPVTVDGETHRRLLALASSSPEAQLSVDLASQTLTLPDGQAITFAIDPFTKDCLLEGVDELGYLARLAPRIAAYEQAHPARVSTLDSVQGRLPPAGLARSQEDAPPSRREAPQGGAGRPRS
jgi:3-isopropylmalate/(R)-2-methylmalate dehydratase small subunit